MNSFLESMSMGRKFAVVGFFALVMFVLPFTMYLKVQNADLQAAEMERKGAESIPYIAKLLQVAQKHRGMNSAVRNGNQAMQATRDGVGNEVTNAFDTLIEKMNNFPELKGVEDAKRIKADWLALLKSGMSLRLQ